MNKLTLSAMVAGVLSAFGAYKTFGAIAGLSVLVITGVLIERWKTLGIEDFEALAKWLPYELDLTHPDSLVILERILGMGKVMIAIALVCWIGMHEAFVVKHLEWILIALLLPLITLGMARRWDGVKAALLQVPWAQISIYFSLVTVCGVYIATVASLVGIGIVLLIRYRHHLKLAFRWLKGVTQALFFIDYSTSGRWWKTILGFAVVVFSIGISAVSAVLEAREWFTHHTHTSAFQGLKALGLLWLCVILSVVFYKAHTKGYLVLRNALILPLTIFALLVSDVMGKVATIAIVVLWLAYKHRQKIWKSTKFQAMSLKDIVDTIIFNIPTVGKGIPFVLALWWAISWWTHQATTHLVLGLLPPSAHDVRWAMTLFLSLGYGELLFKKGFADNGEDFLGIGNIFGTRVTRMIYSTGWNFYFGRPYIIDRELVDIRTHVTFLGMDDRIPDKPEGFKTPQTKVKTKDGFAVYQLFIGWNKLGAPGRTPRIQPDKIHDILRGHVMERIRVHALSVTTNELIADKDNALEGVVIDAFNEHAAKWGLRIEENGLEIVKLIDSQVIEAELEQQAKERARQAKEKIQAEGVMQIAAFIKKEYPDIDGKDAIRIAMILQGEVESIHYDISGGIQGIENLRDLVFNMGGQPGNKGKGGGGKGKPSGKGPRGKTGKTPPPTTGGGVI